jgi:hypothetical protein
VDWGETMTRLAPTTFRAALKSPTAGEIMTDRVIPLLSRLARAAIKINKAITKRNGSSQDWINATIDQHVDARGRENDLAPVMKAHPELLGIGLDESTSITVHGDTLTCMVKRPKPTRWPGAIMMVLSSGAEQ